MEGRKYLIKVVQPNGAFQIQPDIQPLSAHRITLGSRGRGEVEAQPIHNITLPCKAHGRVNLASTQQELPNGIRGRFGCEFFSAEVESDPVEIWSFSAKDFTSLFQGPSLQLYSIFSSTQVTENRQTILWWVSDLVRSVGRMHTSFLTWSRPHGIPNPCAVLSILHESKYNI